MSAKLYSNLMNTSFYPVETEGILRKFQKVMQLISKIMLPPKSLSQYLSNEYQCYGV
jgi:hypothetical protein